MNSKVQVHKAESASLGHSRLLQRNALRPVPSILPPLVDQVMRSPGQPLDATSRAYFEPRFGHNFSRVRVHTDDRAASSAHAVNALAYTVGSDIVMGAGSYQPHSSLGRRLLAHELTHVVQQEGSAVNSAAKLPLSAVAGAAEQEAESISWGIARGQTVELISRQPPQLACLRKGVGTQGNLSSIMPNWSYVVYEKEIKLMYYYPGPPETAPVQIGSIPWLTNDPGNMTIDPKKRTAEQAAANKGSLQTAPYDMSGFAGAYTTAKGRSYAIFSSTEAGRDAILPYLKAIAQFSGNTSMTVEQAFKTFKGRDKNETEQVKQDYVDFIKTKLLEGGMSGEAVANLMQKKIVDVDPDMMKPAIAAQMQKEGSLPPGVTYNCNGFLSNSPSLYDGRQKRLIEALKSNLLINAELSAMLGCADKLDLPPVTIPPPKLGFGSEF